VIPLKIGQLELPQNDSEIIRITYLENTISRNYKNLPYCALGTYCRKFNCRDKKRF
jgi:hypothetical protein